MKRIIILYLVCFTALTTMDACKKDQINATSTTSPGSPPITTNLKPVADAGADQSVLLPTDSAVLTGIGRDNDGIVIEYRWRKISGPAGLVIANPADSQTKIFNLVQGVYSIELQVTDDGYLTAHDTVSIHVTIPFVNSPPVANAGPDQHIQLPLDIAELLGSGSDRDGHVVGYSWRILSGPHSFQILSPNTAETKVTNLVIGLYLFELSVTDNMGARASDSVIVKVGDGVLYPPDGNQPPVAVAGPDQVIYLGAGNFKLQGRGIDNDGSILNYRWIITAYFSQTGQIRNFIFNTADVDFDVTAEGTYWCELIVTDSQGLSHSDALVVQVVAEGCPCYPSPCDGFGDPCNPWDY